MTMTTLLAILVPVAVLAAGIYWLGKDGGPE